MTISHSGRVLIPGTATRVGATKVGVSKQVRILNVSEGNFNTLYFADRSVYGLRKQFA
jgi:hypothetical protein